MSDIEIARKAKKKHVKEIAAKLNLEEKDLLPYGLHPMVGTYSVLEL